MSPPGGRGREETRSSPAEGNRRGGAKAKEEKKK